jgi:hypothetical protein
MRRTFSTAIGILGLVATLVPTPASARQSDLRPGLTKEEFEAFTAELGSVLRFRQVGDTTALGKGKVELGVQFTNTPFDQSKSVWSTAHDVGRSISYPQVVARFGVSDRVDVGAWGAVDPQVKYGLVGVDTKIALLRQSDGRPVSVSVRPSIATLVYPSQVLIGTASVDLSVSRAFGPLSPYAGVAASTSGAVERSDLVDLDPVSAGRSLVFAGLSYRWRTLNLSAEVEKGARFNYAFRIGTRF